MGGRGYGGGGKREIIYLSLHCHHQNDFCIKVGSDESHFNFSLIVRDKATRQCPQTTTFEEKGERKRNRTEVLPLTSLPPYREAKPALYVLHRPHRLFLSPQWRFNCFFRFRLRGYQRHVQYVTRVPQRTSAFPGFHPK